MELFTEAGLFAYVALLVFVTALVFAVRRPDRAMPRAWTGAAVILALGMTGSALGQRLVERAVAQEPTMEKKVLYMSVGTRETSSNLLLAGLFSLALVGVAAGVSATRDRRQE